jgi:hypothetical protein
VDAIVDDLKPRQLLAPHFAVRYNRKVDIAVDVTAHCKRAVQVRTTEVRPEDGPPRSNKLA